MQSPAPITADAVHDGEPAALAALCAQRGVSVLAYCDQVAAPRQVAAAAADAFARLRSQIVATGDARREVDIEELLLAATRHAAAARGMNAANPPRDAARGCDGLETSLAAQFDQPMTPDQRGQLERHLDDCAAHARAMQRFEAGQRAYERPPKIPLPPRIVEQIIAALVAAAPVKALGGDVDAVRARALQHLEVVSAPRPAPARVPPATAAHGAPSAPAEAPPAPATQPAPSAPAEAPPAPATQPAPSAPAEAAPAAVDVTPPAANEAGSPERPAHVATLAAAEPAQTPTATATPQGGDGRSLRPRAARPPVSERQGAIADKLAVARHRVLGPSRGSVERRRAPRSPLKRRSNGAPAEQSARVLPGESREAELAAIGLFVSVAAIVATVTFLAAPGL